MSHSAPYETLTPDVILDAIDSLGLETDGRFLALNSYENRVYQIGLEDTSPVIAKFYRPNRWSDEAIEDEHRFSFELADQEIPVVPPTLIKGKSLHEHKGFRFAVFTRKGGRWPELDIPENRQWLGRYLGRIHRAGCTEKFSHRPALDIQSFFTEPSEYLLQNDWIPSHIETAYKTLIGDLKIAIDAAFERAGDFKTIRLHGDCHPGNILWTDDGPHIVDLDDCRNGPAMQDLWMLLSGSRTEQTEQLSDIIESYEEFHDFDRRELNLIEPLRTLRLVHYSAWLAKRWGDPAFPLAFPWFEGTRYWEEHLLNLREQASALQEPPLFI